jgi:uncharacterized LabA/DUF88 family protein
MRNITVEMLYCVRHERHLSFISGFQYSVLLLCLLLINTSQAQTYPIKTLEGTNEVIKIRSRTTSTTFTVSCSTDKLILPNYWADGWIKVLNNKFIEIRYYIRGGSGIGLGNTLLLCVSHGKLRQALHIESYSSNLNYSSDLDYKRTTQRIIDTRLALDANNRVHVTTYDTLVSGQNQNFKRTSVAAKKTIVRFDLTKRIFYNYQKNVNTTLITFKNNRDIIKKFVGAAPAFQLNKQEYIFVGSNWYVKDSIKKEYLLVD